MPRHRRIPSYRRHKATGQAVVTIDGRDYYLGKHGTHASRREYERLIAKWLQSHQHDPPSQQIRTPGLDPTVNELILGNRPRRPVPQKHIDAVKKAVPERTRDLIDL